MSLPRRRFLGTLSALPALALPAAAVSVHGQAGSAAAPSLRLNQVGYLPRARKVALLESSQTAAQTFLIRRLGGIGDANGAVAWHGTLSVPTLDPDSGDSLREADFTGLTQPGWYRLEVPGVGQSWSFAIGEHVYDRAWYLTMRAFYGQRCGCAVDLGGEFPGYRHAACHLQTAFDATSGRGGAPHNKGGWHDAGDYGRYSVNAAVATATLLMAYELYAPRLGGKLLDLPDHRDGMPDLLQEVRWNLDWMISLQDADGGVWHKQTSRHFCAFIMPEDDHLPSVVVGTGTAPFKSTAATADLAACCALAARVYAGSDPAYAAHCRGVAAKAWNWAQHNPNVVFRNPHTITTGEYGDARLDDELLWAAAELARTTGDSAYEQALQRSASSLVAAAGRTASWNDVAPLAAWTYLLANFQKAHGDRTLQDQLTHALVTGADALCARAKANGYLHTLSPADYVWGSNGVLANQAMLLLIAERVTGNPLYRATALENLHYLLGRNTFSLSFVTRLGAHPFRHPHHRPSGADRNEEPWPGLLSGGPNRHPGDAVALTVKPQPPAKMYIDAQGAYSMNEIAINWNAPLVFLLSALV